VTALLDHQFELLQTEDDATGVAFGMGQPIHCMADGFDPGTNDLITQDADNPFTGSTAMGRDVRKGSTFTWSLFVNGTTEEDSTASLETLAQAWSGEGVIDKPGAYLILRYALAGRTRRVYGRPRRFSQTMDNRILSGMIPITCDFQRVSPLFFGDAPEIDTLDLVAESAGGVVFPVVFPIISLPSGSDEGELHVGGTRKTYPIIRFTGPIVNPELITSAWSLKLNTTILEDDWIEIDTRPWVMTVRRKSGASVAGVVDPRLSLSKILLTPGNQSMTLRGLSATNTATCTIKRYPAYASI
jgi:hypothetical protein